MREEAKLDKKTTCSHAVFTAFLFPNCRFPVIASSASPACLKALWMLTSEGQQLIQQRDAESAKTLTVINPTDACGFK